MLKVTKITAIIAINNYNTLILGQLSEIQPLNIANLNSIELILCCQLYKIVVNIAAFTNLKVSTLMSYDILIFKSVISILRLPYLIYYTHISI